MLIGCIIEKVGERLDQAQYLDRVLVVTFILFQMIVILQFKNAQEILKDISSRMRELRLLPMPFGLIPDEMISAIDNERLLPGTTFIQKLSEDLPLINETSLMMNQYALH